MANLNVLIRDRKQVLVGLKGKARQVEDSIQAILRWLDRKIKRRRNVPTVEDYFELVSALKTANSIMDEFTYQVEQGEVTFR